MINWTLISNWQNWLIVLLMFYIVMAGATLTLTYIDNSKIERDN